MYEISDRPMRKVQPSELILNKPLPCSVYDEHGNLLLREGYVISIPKHINDLVVRGAFTPSPPPPAPPPKPGAIEDEDKVAPPPSVPPEPSIQSVFLRAEALAMTLKRLHAHLEAKSLQAELSLVVRSLAHAIMQACNDDADALLAACHLDRQHPYLVVQQLLSTTVAEIAARDLGMDGATRLSLMCAALTHDIALLPVQHKLDSQNGPLDATQQAMMRTHPYRTVEILANMGVKDTLWLEFARQHHERMDGSGYPQGLKGNDILTGSRLLGIADSYAAMVTPRPNRHGQIPQEALKALHQQRGSLYDEGILLQFINTLTVYPPGTLARLADGEIGVIRSRQKKGAPLDLWLLYDRNGMPIMRPQRCDPSAPAYAIKEILRVEECRSANVVMKRLWSQN